MKNKILIALAAAAAVGGYLFYTRKKTETTTTTTPPIIPTPDVLTPPVTTVPTPTTPAPQVLQIGDIVAPTTKAITVNIDTFGRFYAGGSDGKGFIDKDLYAGQIIGFAKGAASGINYAKIRGYAYAPKDTKGNLVYDFMIATTLLKKI